jgi:hypothetical protein
VVHHCTHDVVQKCTHDALRARIGAAAAVERVCSVRQQLSGTSITVLLVLARRNHLQRQQNPERRIAERITRSEPRARPVLSRSNFAPPDNPTLAACNDQSQLQHVVA